MGCVDREGVRFLRGREGLDTELRRRGGVLDFSHELKEGLGERLERQSGVVEGFGDSAGEIAELGVEGGGAYRPF